MPYQIVCDGAVHDLDAIQYLLSPQDLAAYDLIPRLVELGVASLKIEGRLKSAEYVANIVGHYRRALNAAWEGRPAAFTPRDVQEMELSFSRGFSHGFLDGTNHKVLVRGDRAKKRGIFVGTVEAVTRKGVRLALAAPVKSGDGLVFDGDDARGLPEQGGRVYEVVRTGRDKTVQDRVSAEAAELRFGHRDVDLGRIRPGQRVWKTDDPELTRRLRRTFEGPPGRKVDLDLSVTAQAGAPLRLEGRTSTGLAAEVAASAPLEAAEHHPATDEWLRAQLDRLGGTTYRLREVTAAIAGGPLVPSSLLNSLRRALVERLDETAAGGRSRALASDPVLPSLRAAIPARPKKGPDEPVLAVLCRTTAQLEAALAAGVRTAYVEYQDITGYGPAVALARAAGATVFIATPRIEKPGEANLFRFLFKQGADGLLVRNAGGLFACVEQGVPFVADFALNAANELTVDLLRQRGALRVTASYDLSFEQLDDLMAAVPPEWLEVVIHQQIPMFHMEHCVFCAFLSPGTDATNCGRPCDRHDVKLRDRVGKEHPLKADVGCRNTLYNAVAQTAAEYLPRLLARGARWLRVEFLDDDAAAVGRTIGLYREAIAGQRPAATLWRDLKALGRYGVTRGPLAVL
jgi:putative protease